MAASHCNIIDQASISLKGMMTVLLSNYPHSAKIPADIHHSNFTNL